MYLAIPCYNEEAVLPETARQLTAKMKSMIDSGLISEKSRIAFINDGSKDKTWEMISRLYRDNPLVCGISLSRNRGHQNALLGGLMTVKEHADMVISLDADLQDDIGVLDGFVRQYYDGCDIVYGVRASRETDTVFKKWSAQAFYRLMKALGVDIVYDHADYRLMSRRALDALAEFREVNLFLRGIVPLIGFQTGIVEYERHERFAGESKYPLRKMLSFAFEGITSFSVRPIRLITMLGALIFSISIIMLIYFFILYLLGRTVAGWATIVISIWAIGGLQLLSIGIIGEYVGKMYMETKARPKYIISEFLNK